MKAIAALLALSLAGCTVGQTRVGFGVAFLADSATTEIGLKQPGVVEENPIARQATITAALAVSLIGVVIAEHLINTGHAKAGVTLYRLGTALHFGAAAWNLSTIERARK